jgi:hypothetical protein
MKPLDCYGTDTFKERLVAMISEMTSKSSLYSLARLLLIIGGLILVLTAALDVVGGLRGLLDLNFRIPSIDFLTGVVIAVIAGFVAFIAAGQIGNVTLLIVVIVLGYLASGIGGILVIIGAVVALVTRFVKT